MIYGMNIFLTFDRDTTAAQHRPITIETLTMDKEKISDAEIDMVAEAFKAQIKGAIQFWTK